MQTVDISQYKLTFAQRRHLLLYGYVKVDNIDKTEYYAFRCPKHGYVISYPQGFWKLESPHQAITLANGTISELRCPRCREESP